MNTREIYKKRIEEAANEFEKEGLRVIFENGANFILNNLWISVEEALPEVSNNYDGVKISHIVLIKCAKGAITRARYIMVGGKIPAEIWECIDAGFGVGGDEVTHWMPIPELKGGEK